MPLEFARFQGLNVFRPDGNARMIRAGWIT